jgi:stage II sporulation protein D
MQSLAVDRRTRGAFGVVVVIAAASFVAVSPVRGGGQPEVTDADLVAASTRTVTLGATSSGQIALIPLEIYVARVLAGEGEPNAPEATQQALAVAIRTYAIFNTGRHKRDGYDLCDSTHCQVPRAATVNSRRAAMATAGRILTYRGAAAEIFYSASCGGRSEVASAVWPTVNVPYLRSAKDDVHDEDVPWKLTLALSDLQSVMNRHGFTGRLKNVSVASRNKSGRAAMVKLSGMRPDRIAGDQFRAAIGTTVVRSTAFSVKKQGDAIEFTGRGYGHGVGMCVIGAGRRARRGETMSEILNVYYPGLKIERAP